MFYHVQSLINEIVADEPDPSAANALQEGLGGQFDEMRTMMQYLNVGKTYSLIMPIEREIDKSTTVPA